jgi:DNA-binding transcriptional LysR family regulator
MRKNGMDRLHAMEVFAAVAEAGSFAGAAKRLRLSPPAVTRAVAALEERLGVRLFNRTTRSLNPTEAGLRFLTSTQRLLAELDEAERSAAGTTAVPSGHLVVTAPVTFGRAHVAPVLAAFLQAQPKVTAALLLLDRVTSLVEEGIDVAVRIGQLPDSTLVARRVGEVRRLLVASPAYLAAHGVPERPEALKEHAVIAFSGLLPGRDWRFVENGRATTVTLAPRLEINDALAALEVAERGHGITLALSYMVGPLLAAGRLVPVLEAFAPPPAPVQIVHPQSRLVAAKVRAFLDFATPRLKERLAAPLSASGRG